MGRSGSTLLQKMLSKHPQIIAPPESYFALYLLDSYIGVNDWTRELKSRFIQDLYTDLKFRFIWNVPKDRVEKVIFNAPNDLTYIEVCNLVRGCFYNKTKAYSSNIFVDKNPIYALFVRKMLTTDKKSKVIHLMRDPRGVINSQISSLGKSNVLLLSQLWNHQNKNIENVSRELNVDYLQVFYEDLISNPEKTLQSICSFLGASFSINMLEYMNGSNEIIEKQNQFYKEIHSSSRKPLSKSIAENWKTNLTKDQLKKISFTTRHLAKSYGYETSFFKNTFRLTLNLFLSKCLLRIKFALVRFYFFLPLIIRKKILWIRNIQNQNKYQGKA